MKGYLGIDCGSVSIKLALISEEGELIDSIYTRNRGILETINDSLAHFKNKGYEILGVGTTGSGREFISLLIGADIVKTEILAHTVGTMHFYPNVRTIMDIGGEDCKIMEVKDGVLTNFIMNNICGAGTGSVIETIANRLGIPIEKVGEIALTYKETHSFPGKCGVFCQSAVVSKLNSGVAKNDIMMGVVRALISNYLTLARGINLSPPYVFQGATAQNKALVKALEEQLEHHVEVPKHCAIMGAIGIALLTKEEGIKKTKFKGFKISDVSYKTHTFQCTDCPNNCNVTQLYDGKELMGAIGTRCGKWTTINALDVGSGFVGKIESNIKINDNLGIIRLELDKVMNFVPGQFCELGIIIDGKEVKRSYSIASDANDGRHLEFCYVIRENGKLSPFIAKQKPGDKIMIYGPHGNFKLQDVNSDIVLIGGGTGIAPLMSIIRSTELDKIKHQVTLFFAFKTQESYVYADELKALAEKYPNFKLIPIASREGKSWKGNRGHVQDHLHLIKTSKNPTFYVCGPFVKDVVGSLKEQGYQEIHSEGW